MMSIPTEVMLLSVLKLLLIWALGTWLIIGSRLSETCISYSCMWSWCDLFCKSVNEGSLSLLIILPAFYMILGGHQNEKSIESYEICLHWFCLHIGNCSLRNERFWDDKSIEKGYTEANRWIIILGCGSQKLWYDCHSLFLKRKRGGIRISKGMWEALTVSWED